MNTEKELFSLLIDFDRLGIQSIAKTDNGFKVTVPDYIFYDIAGGHGLEAATTQTVVFGKVIEIAKA